MGEEEGSSGIEKGVADTGLEGVRGAGKMRGGGIAGREEEQVREGRKRRDLTGRECGKRNCVEVWKVGKEGMKGAGICTCWLVACFTGRTMSI